jgi:SHS2 domain-containing protein
VANYEEVEHAADWEFRVRGDDLPELFVNAAYAICGLKEGAPREELTRSYELNVEGVDCESLLVNWLNDVLFVEESEQVQCRSFEILELDETRLRARVQGVPLQDRQRRIKAVTFHNLEVKRMADGWEASIVVDV